MINARFSESYTQARESAEQAEDTLLPENLATLYRLQFHIVDLVKAIKRNKRLRDITVETVMTAKESQMEILGRLYSATTLPGRKTSKYLDSFEKIAILSDLESISQRMPMFGPKDSKSVIYSCTVQNAADDAGGKMYQALAVYFHYPSSERSLVFCWIGPADETDAAISQLKSAGFDWNSLSTAYVGWLEAQFARSQRR